MAGAGLLPGVVEPNDLLVNLGDRRPFGESIFLLASNGDGLPWSSWRKGIRPLILWKKYCANIKHKCAKALIR